MAAALALHPLRPELASEKSSFYGSSVYGIIPRLLCPRSRGAAHQHQTNLAQPLRSGSNSTNIA